MFREVLQEVVDGTEGGVAGLLMGYDGIPVDHYLRDESGQADVESVGAEYSVILKQICTAAEMLDVGHAREISIRAERMNTVLHILNDEFFVAITLRPNGNVGKARFLLRTRVEKLRSALG